MKRTMALASVGLLLWACGSSPKAPETSASPTVLVGTVGGGEALIALVHESGVLTAYTCGIGDALATHTGWFFGTVQGTTLGPLQSAGGLTLQGTIDATGAAGVLILASGESIPFQAEPARAGAGLYADQDSVALTGLIVTNDGVMAGNAKLGGVGGSTAGSVAVSVPGGAPKSTGTVTVTIPVGSVTRTTLLPPVQSPQSETVTATGPTVIFLVHGMSDNINTNDSNAPEDPVACEGPRNTPFYSRCEWGTDFIPGLFGLDPAKGARLFNLAGKDVSGQRFINDPTNRPLFDENLGITALDASGCRKNATDPETFDPRIAQHFITDEQPVAGKAPQLSVFVTWRDSTTGAVDAGRRITRQAYAALGWYKQTYKRTPAVIFVVQSFGGVLTRFLLSNPPRSDFDTALFNPDKIVVCPEDHTKMDFLRDRTLFMLSLATPHEGSFMAEFGETAKTYVKDTLDGLKAGVDKTELAGVIRAMQAGLATVVQSPPDIITAMENAVNMVDNRLTTPALRDLKFATMKAFNLGPLSPERARRTAASPMAGAAGALIPVYATLGRSPGSNDFNSPQIVDGFTRFKAEVPKVQNWVMQTFLSDVVVRQFFADGYGSVNVAPYSDHKDKLDRRERIFDLSQDTSKAQQFVQDQANGILASLSPWFAGKFGAGVDGIVAYLSSLKLAVFFPKAMIPIHTDVKWKLGLSGSAQVPELALTCKARQVVLDYAPLIQALLTALGDSQKVIDAVSGGNLGSLVTAAGGALADGDALAAGVVTWVTAAVGSGAPDGCQLTGTGNIPDFFKLPNLLNWKVSGTTGSIPAPAWERTTTLASDGEIDTDGAVHATSALGFTLGRTKAFYFEHDQPDGPLSAGKPTFGSWYRLYDNPVTEKYNHGMQYHADVGQWIHDDFLVAGVGPVPQRDGFSAWP